MSTIVLVNAALPSSTPQPPVAAEGINKLPSDILANIASFLPTREKFSTMRQVCKEWNNLPFDGGHLDLSNVTNLSDQGLRNILDGIEKRGGKITSLDLSECGKHYQCWRWPTCLSSPLHLLTYHGAETLPMLAWPTWAGSTLHLLIYLGAETLPMLALPTWAGFPLHLLTYHGATTLPMLAWPTWAGSPLHLLIY